MSDGITGSRGPFAVGLMALHDRDFFERLLTDPRAALTGKIRADLTLTDADVDQVVDLIQNTRVGLPPADALAMWDSYQASGQWSGDWVGGWQPARMPL